VRGSKPVQGSKRSSWLLGAAAFWLLALGPSHALAFEREWHAGAKGGLAFQPGRDTGWGVGAHGAYGLSDMFDAELELFLTQNAADQDQTARVFAATAGVAYKIDIVRWIPYFGLLGGYYDFWGVPGPNGETKTVGMAAQIGLDFLLMREVALSLDYRPHVSFVDGPNIPLQTLMLGVEYRWGL
jgi:hypothetical protein